MEEVVCSVVENIIIVWKTQCFGLELTNLIDPDSDRKWDGRLFGLNSRPAPMSLRHASRHFDPLLLSTPTTSLEVGLLTIQFVFWLLLGLEVHTSLLWLLGPLLNLRVYHVCTYSQGLPTNAPFTNLLSHNWQFPLFSTRRQSDTWRRLHLHNWYVHVSHNETKTKRRDETLEGREEKNVLPESLSSWPDT